MAARSQQYAKSHPLFTWTTTNSYNNNGALLSTAYSGSTPSVAMVYDRRGRAATVTNGTAVCTFAYNDANELLSESYSGGILGGLSVTNGYDTLLRRTALSALNSSTPLLQHSFAFDNASRLTNVTDGTYSAAYAYLANSPLLSQIALKSNTTARMTTTKQYDYLNRLLSISSSPSSSSSLPISYAYGYNDANQRTRVALNDGSFWVYQYDALGQVNSGKKYFNDNTPVPGQQFEYGFDDIGNRTSTKAGGDQSGAGLRPASYGANSLNQYTNRTVPSAFDVIGIANAASGVTVNSSAADYRRGEYFQELASVNNSSTSVWQNVSVTTSGGGTNTGNVFVPTATESYGYDADGNMTNDGRWTFTWDAENRLTTMQALSSVPSGAKKKLDFTYDYAGRRTQKIVSTWNGSAYVPQSTNKSAYDAWNMVAELNGTNGVIRSYIWGLDLSGTAQGAGGVGGLLAIKPNGANPLFVAYDGNGNVAGLIDATAGTTSGQFEYGPFGETVRLTPNANNQSPFRFSTKYTDDESDFVYYGFRYYNPSTGRWASRDPIEEQGGLNLYAFVGNSPVNRIDPFGLDDTSPWGAGWEWLTGTGPADHTHAFGNGDPFTELLKQHQHIEDLRKQLREQLAKQCAKCDTTALKGDDDYKLSGLQGVPKYLNDYSTLLTGGLTGNLAVTYLGSYQLTYRTTRILCKKGIGVVHFRVYNTSTIQSATHPPVIGYTQWWSTYIGNPLNNFFSSGPMSQTTQTFDWDENLDFKGNPCCKK